MRPLCHVSHPAISLPILPSNEPNETVDFTRCLDCVSKSPPCANLPPPFQNCLNREWAFRLLYAVMHPYRVWQQQKYCAIYSSIGCNQSFCHCCKEQNSRHQACFLQPLLQQLVSISLCCFTPHTRFTKKNNNINMTTDPERAKTQTAFLAILSIGVGDGICSWGCHRLTHSCTHTYEVTHRVWDEAKQHMAKL